MRTLKRFSLAAVSLVLILSVLGCGPQTTPPVAGPTAAPTESTVKLQMMVVDYIPDKTDTWLENEVVPAFKKDHPNIDVEFVYVSWGTLDETVQGYYAAGEGADIINLGAEYIADYGDRLAPLDQYFAGWDGLAQFVPGTLDNVTWDGKVRGIPWLTAPRAYMCRTDILANAGITTMPKTFADMVSLVKKVTVIKDNAIDIKGYQATGASAMAGSVDWQELVSLIWSLGGSLYKPDGTPNFDSPEARAALQYAHDIHRGDFPDNTVADLPEATGALLGTGKLACFWGNLWGAPASNDPIWQQIELIPGFTNPDFPNGKPVVTVFNDWLGVPSYSKHAKEAAEFLMFLGSAENLNTYNAAFGSFPPRKDAWTGFVQNDLVMQKLGALMQQYGYPFADVRISAQLRDILHAEVPLYLRGEQDIETTIANIQTRYTDALREAGRIP